MEEEEQLGLLAEPAVAPPPPIEDPWYSRPLDVHRWSDHREITAIVAALWAAHFQDMERSATTPGPKPKASFRNQFRMLLLDLYVAWLEDPALCIGVSMSENYWDTTSRYNALGISKKIIPIIKRMQEAGLIDLAGGSYGGPYAPYNRTTRIRASRVLQDTFRGLTVTRDDIKRIENEECIILREGLVIGDGSKVYHYDDTDETNRMREELQAYNRVLADSFIDIPTLDEAVMQRTDQFGRVFKQGLDHHHHFVRRVFSRGSWEMNGRFYGAWWQLIPSGLRKDIYINDTPTVEVDFKGLHVSLLSAEKGVELNGDPYALADGLLPGTPALLQRSLVKQLVLTALNAKDKKSAFQSFREGWPVNHYGKGMTNEELVFLLDAFTEKHPHLADAMGADQGIRLMNLDGRIAERVHKRFTDQGVPVLSVHDSFIIDYTRVGELRRVMAAASEAVIGRPMEVSATAAGLDEMDPAVRLDFVAWVQAPRSPAYLRRIQNWEARVGREVIPYG